MRGSGLGRALSVKLRKCGWECACNYVSSFTKMGLAMYVRTSLSFTIGGWLVKESIPTRSI